MDDRGEHDHYVDGSRPELPHVNAFLRVPNEWLVLVFSVVLVVCVHMLVVVCACLCVYVCVCTCRCVYVCVFLYEYIVACVSTLVREEEG